MYQPPHPGAILKDGMGDLNISDFAKHLGITRVTLSRILNGKQGISADMSLRLAKALGTHDDLWLKLQLQYDLWQAKQKADYSAITPLYA